MPVFKVHKTKDFTVMSNYHLRDSRLSLKAKGLLSLILSLPDDWEHSLSGYVSLCSEGERAVTSALKELRECGYVIVEKLPPEKGSPRIRYQYSIFETPQLAQALQNVGLQDEGLHGEGLQNAGELNKENKTCQREFQSRKDSQVELSGEVEFQPLMYSQVCSSSTYDFPVSNGFVPPTVEEVRNFCATNMLDKVDPELFVAYYDSVDWMRGRTPIARWEPIAKSWNSDNRNREASAFLRGRQSKAPAADYSDLNEGWRTLDGTN